MTDAKTILLLVHEPADREFLKKELQSRLENPITTVQTVYEAMDYLQGTGLFADRDRSPFPILLLLDLQIPDTTGFSILEWCKNHRDKEIRTLPIAVIAELKDIGTVNRSYALGADTFFARPFNFKEFENWIYHFNWLTMHDRCIIPAVGSGVSR
jgi:CheY-like chemotaxis protein